MPEINIRTDGYCSNLDAIEAISEFIIKNNEQQKYKRVHSIRVKSKRLLKVVETKRSDELHTCNATFEITTMTKGSTKNA